MRKLYSAVVEPFTPTIEIILIENNMESGLLESRRIHGKNFIVATTAACELIDKKKSNMFFFYAFQLMLHTVRAYALIGVTNFRYQSDGKTVQD